MTVKLLLLFRSVAVQLGLHDIESGAAPLSQETTVTTKDQNITLYITVFKLMLNFLTINAKQLILLLLLLF